MSGKKNSEVAAVLRQGEDVRRMSDRTFNDQIEKSLDNFRQCMKKIKSLQSDAEKLNANVSAEAETMFGDKAKSQLKAFEDLKAALSKVKLNASEDKNIKSTLNDLDRQLSDADREADAIRNIIRTKPHYCDDEYRRAQQLVGRYGSLRDQRSALQTRANQVSQSASRTLNQIRADSNQLSDMIKQLDDMNDVAKKRKQANEMRDELRRQLDGIDKSWATKFFSSEYAELKSDVERESKGNDEAVINKFNGVFGSISTFKTKLQARVELWKRQKADAEGMLDEVEGLATLELVEPIDYYNEGADAQRTEMFDYINRYGGKDLRTGYQRELDAARDLIRDEKFLEGIDKLKRASELVMEARDVGIKLQDSMLKKIELAGAIQDVMSDLRYQVGLSIVNDNPNDGFKLTCSIGDETINFDRVDIDADGKIIIDVDHHESVGGTCGATWKDISKRLNEEGIPVTDVLKGDRSVLHPERKVQTDGGTRQTAAG